MRNQCEGGVSEGDIVGRNALGAPQVSVAKLCVLVRSSNHIWPERTFISCKSNKSKSGHLSPNGVQVIQTFRPFNTVREQGLSVRVWLLSGSACKLHESLLVCEHMPDPTTCSVINVVN